MSSTESRPAPRASRRTPRWLRIVAWQLVFLLAGAVLAEVGTRIWLGARGAPFDTDTSRARIELFMSRAIDLVPHAPGEKAAPLTRMQAVQVPVLQPYTGYVVTGVVDQLDFELKLSQANHDASRYEILVVGGSVAAMFGALGEKHFVERLSADPTFAGKSVYVYEYGMGGFKQPQMVNLVQYFLALGFAPECVIDIDGFNDVALANANAVAGSSPLLPSIGHWGSLTNSAAPDRETIGAAWLGLEDQAAIVSIGERALRLGAPHSAIASLLVLRALASHEARAHAAFEAYSRRLQERASALVVHGPAFEPGAQAVAEVSARCWEESSRTLRAMCDARGILYLHVLQPTLYDAGSKPLAPLELANSHGTESWIEGVHAGYPLLRAAGQRLRDEGEHFVDATQIFAGVQTALYFDDCHFNAAGNVMLGDRIADELLACMKARR
jgi:hypothetical protein